MGQDMALQDEQFRFADSYLDDIRKLISAGEASAGMSQNWVVGLNAGRLRLHRWPSTESPPRAGFWATDSFARRYRRPIGVCIFKPND